MHELLDEFSHLMSLSTPISFQQREQILNEALQVMGMEYRPVSEDHLPKVHYLEAMRTRVQEKIETIQVNAPAWAQNGGDLKPIHQLLQEFERLHQLSRTQWEIYHLHSSDSGTTWKEPVRLTQAPGTSAGPVIAARNGNLSVAWVDHRDGDPEIYWKFSPDNGASWRDETRLSQSPGASHFPSTAISEKKVHLIWIDERSGDPELFYRQRSF